MRHYSPPPGTRGYLDAGKVKQKKSKDAPKGPLSAYFIFTSHIRPSVVIERPDLNLPGITKEIAQRWRNLSPEERVPFEEQSKLDKQRCVS
jgi:structure-specific recognition protein 1